MKVPVLMTVTVSVITIFSKLPRFCRFAIRISVYCLIAYAVTSFVGSLVVFDKDASILDKIPSMNIPRNTKLLDIFKKLLFT